MKQLKFILHPIPSFQLHMQHELGNQEAVNAWNHFLELIDKGYVTLDDHEFQERIVLQAHRCVVSTEVFKLLHITFGMNIRAKLWRALKFLARPVADCRMLYDIAKRQPRFQKVRIFLVSSMLRTSIHPEYRLTIVDAWTQLSAPPQSLDAKMISKFEERFGVDCRKSYSLHSEMQLFIHHEKDIRLTPSLDYFGCSKKACLLCDLFLKSLPRPINTRGKHGTCYPAWGVPYSDSIEVETALMELEKRIVSRIKACLSNQKTYFTPAVAQSTILSNLSESNHQYWGQKEAAKKKAREDEIARIEEKAIL